MRKMQGDKARYVEANDANVFRGSPNAVLAADTSYLHSNEGNAILAQKDAGCLLRALVNIVVVYRLQSSALLMELIQILHDILRTRIRT